MSPPGLHSLSAQRSGFPTPLIASQRRDNIILFLFILTAEGINTQIMDFQQNITCWFLKIRIVFLFYQQATASIDIICISEK